MRWTFRRRSLYLTFLISLLLFFILTSVQKGIGVTNDSVAYASSAQSFRDSNSLTSYTGQVLDPWPPGLPVILGLIGKTGIDIQNAAILLNAVSACLSAWLIYTLSNLLFESTTLSMISVAAFCVSLSSVQTYSMLWTEPIFIAAELSSMVLLVRSIRRANISIAETLAIATLISFATTLRYIGVVLIPIAMVGIFCVQGRRFRIRSCYALAAGLLSSCGFLMAAFWNRRHGSGVMGTRYPSDSHLSSILSSALRSLGGYAYPGSDSTLQLLIGMIFASLVLTGITRAMLAKRNELRIVAAFTVAYWITLIYSAKTTPLDEIDFRLMSPVFGLMVIFIVYALAWIRTGLTATQRARHITPNDAAITVVLSAVLAASALWCTVYSFIYSHHGIGYNNTLWSHSPLTSAAASAWTSDGIASTNAPWLYWATKREPVFNIPRRDRFNPPEKSAFDMRCLKRALLSGEVQYLAFFDEDKAAYSPEDVSSLARVRLQLVGAFADGRLYMVVPDRTP